LFLIFRVDMPGGRVKRGREWYSLESPRVYLGEYEQRVVCKSCLLEVPGGIKKPKTCKTASLAGCWDLSGTNWDGDWRPNNSWKTGNLLSSVRMPATGKSYINMSSSCIKAEVMLERNGEFSSRMRKNTI